MKNSLRITALLGTAVLIAWPGRLLSAGLEYPGLPPGNAEATIVADTLTIANQAIFAGFSVDGGRLKLLFVRSGKEGPALSFKGEPFQILLTNGTRYSASTLELEGQPIATGLEMKGASSRMADGKGGRKLEARLRSADGRLEFSGV
jgi:hypothetical protein